MPSGSLRAFGNGGRLVRRSLPSGVLLPRVVLQPQGVRVWIMDSFLRRGVRGADECNGRVVCHRGRRVDSERTGGVLGGGGRWKWWRWGLHASCGDVDCGGVPRTHCGLERDGGCIWGVRRQWHKRRGGGWRGLVGRRCTDSGSTAQPVLRCYFTTKASCFRDCY